MLYIHFQITNFALKISLGTNEIWAVYSALRRQTSAKLRAFFPDCPSDREYLSLTKLWTREVDIILKTI